MTKLTEYGEVKSSDNQKLSLDNSVEIDEEDPMVQVIQEIPKKKNYRMIFLVAFGFLVIVGVCISLGILIGMYLSDNEGEDVHYIGDNEDTPEMEDTNMEAHFTNWNSHKKHKKKTCSDKFGCCEIQFGCENQTKSSLHLSPYLIMKHDEEGSNCPTIDSLVQTYNEKFQKHCVIDGCHKSPNCPNAYELVNLYNTEWYDPGQDMMIISIIFMVILSMIGIYCCHIQCFENCPFYRNSCKK